MKYLMSLVVLRVLITCIQAVVAGYTKGGGDETIFFCLRIKNGPRKTQQNHDSA